MTQPFVSASAPLRELAVPKSLGSVIGHGLFFIVPAFFVLLACYSLLTFTAVIPSIVWLIFYGYLLFDSCKKQGTRQFAIETLGSLALREFVWTTASNGLTEIQFGYRLFGRNFLYHRIPAAQFETIRWGTGQASSMAGRDVGDWQVSVWFDHQKIHCVGPTGRKERITTFAHGLIRFLKESGLPLVPGTGEQSYYCDTETAAANSNQD